MYQESKIHIRAKTFNNSPKLETQMPTHRRMGKSAVVSSPWSISQHSGRASPSPRLSDGSKVQGRSQTPRAHTGRSMCGKVGRPAWPCSGTQGGGYTGEGAGVVIRKETETPRGLHVPVCRPGTHMVCLRGNYWAVTEGVCTFPPVCSTSRQAFKYVCVQGNISG